MIVFKNKGVIDLLAISTMGANSKSTDTAIGYFGTGLKYALAVCMRLGQGVTIWRGLQAYKVRSRVQRIQHHDFDIVELEPQQHEDGCPLGHVPLGFTTALGKNWEAWQAFRELLCNAMDEGGGVSRDAEPEEGHTCIQVFGADMGQCYEDRGRIVLESEPLIDLGSAQVHPQGGRHEVYYRGVRVFSVDKPMLHAINFTGEMRLTEDRTLQYGQYVVAQRFKQALKWCPNKEYIRNVLMAPDGTFEADLDWADEGGPFIPLFLEVLGECWRLPGFNKTARTLHGKLKREAGKEYEPCQLTADEERDFAAAVKLCAALGYDVMRHPPVVTEELPPNILGVTDMGTHAVYINRLTISQGLTRLASTLLEEHLHAQFALPDMSRGMQDHLLDHLVTCAQRLQRAGDVAPVPNTVKADDDAPF